MNNNDEVFNWDDEIGGPHETVYTTNSIDYEAYKEKHFEEFIISALAYIDPVGLSYEEWLNIGIATKNSGLDVTVWDEWSQRDTARYEDFFAREGCLKKWNSFKGTAKEEITAGTIFKLAQENGWKWPAPDQASTGTATPAPKIKKKEPKDLKIKCYIDKEQFNHKPISNKNGSEKISEPGRIRNRVPQKIDHDASLEEIIDALAKGQTIIPCMCEKTPQGYRAIEQQLFVVDIDNDKKVNGERIRVPQDEIMDTEKILEKSKAAGIEVAFIYQTFSSKEHREDKENPYKKYHIGIVMDKPITVREHGESGLDSVRDYLISVYGTGADTVTGDAARLIYGTRGKEEFETISATVNNSRAIYDKAESYRLGKPEPMKEEKKEEPKPEPKEEQRIKSVMELEEEFKAFQKAPDVRISTGYEQLDICLSGGFTNELYVMTAATGIGKSAVAIAFAENIARSGTDVLYFAVEMSAREIIARGIAAETHRQKSEKRPPIEYREILNSKYEKGQFVKIPYSRYEESAARYFKTYGEHLHVIECGTVGTTVGDIVRTVKAFKARKGVKKVAVFVDYLQILSGDKKDPDQRDTMGKMNVISRTLKAMASQEGDTVFLISSMANEKDGEKVTELAPKYSGDIAYTAGVMFGLNWEGVTETSDTTDRAQKTKDDNGLGYRHLILGITKNRNGERGKEVDLYLYPAYNRLTDRKPEGATRAKTKYSKTVETARKKAQDIENDIIKAINEYNGQYAPIDFIAEQFGAGYTTEKVKRILKNDVPTIFEVYEDEEEGTECVKQRVFKEGDLIG